MVGGAMDLVASGRTVMVMMEHRDSRDRPKAVQRCSYALTGKACVDILVTDLALTAIGAATGMPVKAENP